MYFIFHLNELHVCSQMRCHVELYFNILFLSGNHGREYRLPTDNIPRSVRKKLHTGKPIGSRERSLLLDAIYNDATRYNGGLSVSANGKVIFFWNFCKFVLSYEKRKWSLRVVFCSSVHMQLVFI